MTDNHHKGPPNSPPNLPVALQFPTRWCPTPHLLLPHRLSPLLSQSLHSLSTCPYQSNNSFKHSHSCKFSRRPRWHHFQQTKYHHYSNNSQTSVTLILIKLMTKPLPRIASFAQSSSQNLINISHICSYTSHPQPLHSPHPLFPRHNLSHRPNHLLSHPHGPTIPHPCGRIIA